MERKDIDLYLVCGSLFSPRQGGRADMFSVCLQDSNFTSLCLCLLFKAPHEICKEEHLLAMSWKRASAGETVYNKCPTNATGQ